METPNPCRWFLLGILSLCGAAISSAEPALDAPAKPGPIPQLPWLHTGLRLNYKVTDAAWRGDVGQITDNQDGTWASAITNGAGVGIAQFTIAGLTQKKVATNLQEYLVDLVTKKMIWESARGQVSDNIDNKLGAGWIVPAELVALEKNPPPGFRASRVVWSNGERKSDAVFFRGVIANVYTSFIYDVATGLTLQSATRRHLAEGRQPGTGYYQAPGTQLHISEFVSEREIVFPWADEAPPPWVARITALHFAGQSVLHALTPGAPETPQPGREEDRVTSRPEGWLVVHEAMQVGNVPSALDTVWTGFSLGSGWLGPKALQRLHQGDVIDKDPLTGVRTVVAHTDANGVMLSQSNGVTEQSYLYDPHTGMLTAMHASNPSLHTEIGARLTGKE